MEAGRLKLTIESAYENVVLVGSSVNRICREAGFSDQAAFEVELSVVEAVNNAIKHAYCESPGKVEVSLELTPGTLNIKVTDAGRAMPQEFLQPAGLQDEAAPTLADSGRGLFIIHSLMDQVSYVTAGGKNTLSLTRNLKAPGRSDNQG